MSKEEPEIVILPTDGFIRSDTNPAAIINVDNSALKAYKTKRMKDQQKNDEINTLRSEVNELKHLLYKLLSEKNK